MSAASHIDELRAAYVQDCGTWFDGVLAHCDSPIEQALVGSMLVNGWKGDDGAGRCFQLPPYFHGNDASRYILNNERRVICAIQARVDLPGRPGPSWRVDFLFYDRVTNAVLVVETDGHDFHERTKEQAKRDRSRDRTLALIGWPILRFTGSEIHASPLGALAEIHAMLAGRRKRR